MITINRPLSFLYKYELLTVCCKNIYLLTYKAQYTYSIIGTTQFWGEGGE